MPNNSFIFVLILQFYYSSLNKKRFMIKRFLQSLVRKTGYTIVSNKHYNRMFDINEYSQFDCLYLMKDIYSESSGLVLFDIGANEGQTSLKLLNHFNEPRIYCFEPFENT